MWFLFINRVVISIKVDVWMQITAIDFNQEGFDMGIEFMKKAGVDHKINFIKSDALKALDQLVNGVCKHCSYPT